MMQIIKQKYSCPHIQKNLWTSMSNANSIYLLSCVTIKMYVYSLQLLFVELISQIKMRTLCTYLSLFVLPWNDKFCLVLRMEKSFLGYQPSMQIPYTKSFQFDAYEGFNYSQDTPTSTHKCQDARMPTYPSIHV